ncbi:9131_t:CDS:2 [Ambispora gerdemannii]|uniref:9131_t:CDS:1 n=1 Tax=Ambispora gerdemannii TaxID=144530 RepID=A0A9N9GG34_9GLOM|nr:9131_t:CDS:2 [Ambispora gerdemannii]
MTTKLYPYQENVVDRIEEKFNQHVEKILKQEISAETPSVCFLKSITGSGKTAMLTATAERLLKKKVYPLSQLRSTLPTTDGHIIYLATTSTFNINVKNKEDYRLIYDKGEDEGGVSGHHFTSQQVDMLLELEPEGIILASGTPTYAGRLGGLIEQAKIEMEDLVVSVPTSKVVNEGLIKTKLLSFGYDETSMEGIINSLVEDLNKLNKLAKKKGLPNLKAIYVCKTNLLETESRQKDNLDLPFEQRKSPPILI